ncbi:retrovirus-related Pol polyprotein from transposon opus [Nephila pilipes]|uniref:Retrovirus-related Pol polyprotein from transposon opus n=1 Tax=Nephila pilipes TaxID=299642 RepID=A0A8X6QRG2_NEPPI|nr:retrovirus-related Pol polyprotein from transposon opus [Nephila pilipes]
MTEKYLWPNIIKQVREWTTACIRCKKCKGIRHENSKFGEYQAPDERFSVVHIDFIGPLPLSEGMMYCLTCIDQFSCWMEVVPLLDIIAEIVGKHFMNIGSVRSLKGAIKAHNNIEWIESLPTVLLGLRAALRPDVNHTIAQMAYGAYIKLPGEFFNRPSINMDPQNFVTELQQHLENIRPLKSPNTKKQKKNCT